MKFICHLERIAILLLLMMALPYAFSSCQPTVSYGDRTFITQGVSPNSLICSTGYDTSKLNNLEVSTSSDCYAYSGSHYPVTIFSDGNKIEYTTGGCPPPYQSRIDSFKIRNYANQAPINITVTVMYVPTSPNCDSITANGAQIIAATAPCANTIQNVTISNYNTTHMIINGSGGSTTFAIGGDIAIQKATSISMPVVNVTNTYEFYQVSTSSVADYAFNTNFRLILEADGKYTKATGGALTGYNTFPTSNIFLANIVQGTSLVVADEIWYPGTTEYAYATAYSNATTITTLRNNTPTYVHDSQSNLWYFCPAYAAASSSTVYTITCVFAPDTSTTTYNLNASMVFLNQNCWASGDTYYWDLKSTESLSYMTRADYTTNSTVFVAGSGTTFTGNISLVNASNVTIYYNGIPTLLACAWSNDTYTLIGLNSVIFNNYNVTRTFGQLFFYFTLGTGVIFPPALIGSVVVNDAFLFLTVTQMMATVVTIIIISMIALYSGDKNMKTAGLYVAVGLGIVAWLGVSGILTTYTDTGAILHAGVMNPPASLTSLTAAFQNMPTVLSSNDLVSITVGSFDLLFQILLFIFTIPVTLVDLVVMPLASVNMNLFNAVSSASVFLKIGMYIYIAIKIIEVVSNRFRGI